MVVRQMVAGGMLGAPADRCRGRRSNRRRRLGSLAFVAENPEDPYGGLLVQEFCSYAPSSDDWHWEGAALAHVPSKIRDKLQLAEIDPAHLLVHVVDHD
jgi:hypothetical protein